MTQPLSDRELREMLEQATPGLWEWRASDGYLLAGGTSRGQIDRDADAQLIVAAPALAEEVLRLRSSNEVYRDTLGEIADPLTVPLRNESERALRLFQDLARAALQEGSAE